HHGRHRSGRGRETEPALRGVARARGPGRAGRAPGEADRQPAGSRDESGEIARPDEVRPHAVHVEAAREPRPRAARGLVGTAGFPPRTLCRMLHGMKSALIPVAALFLGVAAATAQTGTSPSATPEPPRKLAIANKPWTGDFDKLLERRMIRVYSP